MAELKDMMLNDDDLEMVNGGCAMVAVMDGKANAASNVVAVQGGKADSSKNMMLGNAKTTAKTTTTVKASQIAPGTISGGIDLNGMC